MTVLNTIAPTTAHDGVQTGDMVLVDIREPDEFAREHIPGAISMPLSELDMADIKLDAGQKAVFHCRSGRRTDMNCDALADHVTGDAFILDGGLDAWRSAGLPTAKDASAPLEINRQVQITAGALVLTGIVLGWFINPALFGLSAFVGAGLMFAGISGWCGMANLLAVMPWNRQHKAS